MFSSTADNQHLSHNMLSKPSSTTTGKDVTTLRNYWELGMPNIEIIGVTAYLPIEV